MGKGPYEQLHGHAKAGGRNRVAAVADDREQQWVTPAGLAGDRPDEQAGSRRHLALLYQLVVAMSHRGMRPAAKEARWTSTSVALKIKLAPAIS